MRKFFDKVIDFFIHLIVGLFRGFVGGLMALMAVLSMLHKPFWCLGFTFFFVLFHLSDFREFFATRNWLAISGRFIVLFAITSSILSFFVLAFGGIETLGILDLIAFLFIIPFSLIAVTFWTFLARYGSETRLYKECLKIVDGLRVIGVLWKY